MSAGLRASVHPPAASHQPLAADTVGSWRSASQTSLSSAPGSSAVRWRSSWPRPASRCGSSTRGRLAPAPRRPRLACWRRTWKGHGSPALRALGRRSLDLYPSVRRARGRRFPARRSSSNGSRHARGRDFRRREGPARTLGRRAGGRERGRLTGLRRRRSPRSSREVGPHASGRPADSHACRRSRAGLDGGAGRGRHPPRRGVLGRRRGCRGSRPTATASPCIPPPRWSGPAGW